MATDVFSRRSVLTLGTLAGASILAACGSRGDSSAGGRHTPVGSASGSASSSATAPSSSESVSTQASGGTSTTLVAYYSEGGHTRRVAEQIATTLGADIFEIQLAEPYTDDDLNFNEESSLIVREYLNESLRDKALATTTPANWGQYDTVIFAYPIWWSMAAWAVNRFASDNDFTGKTVIPVATSLSSGLGRSACNLEALAGTGTWQEGMRFSQSVDESEVVAWAQGLGL